MTKINELPDYYTPMHTTSGFDVYGYKVKTIKCNRSIMNHTIMKFLLIGTIMNYRIIYLLMFW